MTEPLEVTCDSCHRDFKMSSGSILTRQGPGEFRDVGIRCPKCKTFYHVYYTNDELDRRRGLLRQAEVVVQKVQSDVNVARYRRAKTLYTESFDQVQTLAKQLKEASK